MRDNLPKAIAAKNRLERINSEIEIDAVVADVGPRKCEGIARRHRHLARRNGQFRNAVSVERSCPKPGLALGLWRLHRSGRPDHDDRAWHYAVPGGASCPMRRHREPLQPAIQLGS